MTRGIKLYLLVVVLPAVALTVGGIRLVFLESARARQAAVDSLNVRALEIASSISDALKSGGVDRAKAKMHPFRPPPPPPEGRFWKNPPPRPGCRRHELDPGAKAIVEAELAKVADVVCEVRHACGCTVFPEAKIQGSITGSASLKPPFSDYFVFAAPVGGDGAIAGGVRTQAILSGIFVFLLLATFAGGTALLVRSAKKARDEARRQTDFLSNVSHELKTPLTSITMFAEMLAGPELDAEQREKAAGVVRKESRRLAGLVETLLDFARLERGGMRLEKTKLDLAAIAQDAADAWAGRVGVAVEGSSRFAAGDAGAVRRILDCLLDNARKYAPAGKVSIALFDGAIEVADCGEGISPADRKHIFERFWRADNSITRTAGGTGLGLAIARHLARAMGGELSFRPNSPSGAVFRLELPNG